MARKEEKQRVEKKGKQLPKPGSNDGRTTKSPNTTPSAIPPPLLLLLLLHPTHPPSLPPPPSLSWGE